MVRALASLHAVDVEAVGLADFGSPTHYCARQLRRWEGQYAVSIRLPGGNEGVGTGIVPPSGVDRLLAWLHAHVPTADAKPDKCGLFAAHLELVTNLYGLVC
jgi:aminoglycoside phosphotransferase (APT) family kinase protein